jgi:hypothetical protein
MVNSSSEGDLRQSLPTSTDYFTLNHSQLKELSTSGFGKESLKDSIRRRLTARVVPMTRNKRDHIKNTEEEIRGNFQKRSNSETSFVHQSSSETSIIEHTGSVIKTEKIDTPVCKASSDPWHNVNYGKHRVYEDSQLEPQPKQRRIYSPSITSQKSK